MAANGYDELGELGAALSPAMSSGADIDEMLASGDPSKYLASLRFGPRAGTPPAVSPLATAAPMMPATNAPNPASETTRTPTVPATVTPSGTAQTPTTAPFSDLARHAQQVEAQRAAAASPANAANPTGVPNPMDPQYRPSVGRRIVRGVLGGLAGLGEGGIKGALVGAVSPQATTGVGYSSPTRAFSQAATANAQRVASLDQQLGQANTQSELEERSAKAQKEAAQASADQPITLSAEQASAIGHPELEGMTVGQRAYSTMANKKGSGDLRKYQLITASDGSMYRIDPDDPTTAEPIMGPGGKPLKGKGEAGKIVPLKVNGQEHSVMVDDQGNTIKDLGETGQKPPTVHVDTGTWSIQEDDNGKPIMFNSKTGQSQPASGVQRSGTKAKADAAQQKLTGPVDVAEQYANDYMTNKSFTGAGDEALQEKFFELAKPSTGFRMTQPQIDMLQNSRSWMQSLAAKARHATTGTWFSDDQRKQIVDTMKQLADSKRKTMGGQSGSAPSNTGGQTGKTQAFTDGGRTYNIPAGMVEEFKKDHPNAR